MRGGRAATLRRTGSESARGRKGSPRRTGYRCVGETGRPRRRQPSDVVGERLDAAETTGQRRLRQVAEGGPLPQRQLTGPEPQRRRLAQLRRQRVEIEAADRDQLAA